MSLTTTMTAPAPLRTEASRTSMQAASAPSDASGLARLLAKVRTWLGAKRGASRRSDDGMFLAQAVDHCDLEWRLQRVERSWGSSSFGVGGHSF